MNPQDKILCTRLLQTLDSEERFGVPYGTVSPFHFGFRDFAFSHPGSRSYKYYVDLRSYRSVRGYRHAAVELYKDDKIEIEVNGERHKFPIQIISIPLEDQKNIAQIASKNGYKSDILEQQQEELVFLSSLPSPRLLATPPQGKNRSDYMILKTNKVIDIALITTQKDINEGKKALAQEISKCLAPVEPTLAFASKTAQYLANSISKPVGISLRGTIADNPVVFEDSFRVPVSGKNFYEISKEKSWPTLDIDLDIFCGEEDFEEVYKTLSDESLFFEVNAEIKGSNLQNTKPQLLFYKEENLRSIDIYLMTEEWVMKSVERHLNLGFEQPWAYYYFNSHSLLFDDWPHFLKSLNRHIFN
ncbi:hypothetical protein [Candidatus Uabimicrobium sp. HlEnr_7]|uniref:hypothetical protein n=1 Tax=Candidatus Uabimicrobium helgolandensis TaxID=3095367 RepID=UPI0035568427